MGNTAVSYLKQSRSYWEAASIRRLSPNKPRKSGYTPQRINLEKTFAEMIEAEGWIIIPGRSRGQETLPSYVINRDNCFPNIEDRTLPAFARTFGFLNAEDRDQFGKNIFHQDTSNKSQKMI